jgi:hypothetical protein
LAALGFELGFMLARQAFYHLSHSTSPVLCSQVSFEIGFLENYLPRDGFELLSS